MYHQWIRSDDNTPPGLGGDTDQIEDLVQALADAGFCTVAVNSIKSDKWKPDFLGCLRIRVAALAAEFFGPMAWGSDWFDERNRLDIGRGRRAHGKAPPPGS
jgi:hypothetical protein